MACPCENQSEQVSNSLPCTPQNPCNGCGCEDCGDCSSSVNCDSGCTQELDFRCIIYGKNGLDSTDNALPMIIGDNLYTVLERIVDKLDSYNPLNLNGIAFGYLNDTYHINSFKDFAEAVVTELSKIKTSISALESRTNSLTCFTFTITNNSNTVATYSTRTCNGTLLANQQLLPNKSQTITGRSVIGSSSNISIINHGII